MSDIEWVEGLRVYAPHEKTPSFVKAAIVIDRVALMTWLAGKSDKEVRLDIKESRSGKLYAAVNTYQRPASASGQPLVDRSSGGGGQEYKSTPEFSDDIPFATSDGLD